MILSAENIGPIEEFRTDIAEPGLWLLRGRQGCGKTTILRTVQYGTTGNVDVMPTKRDGSKAGVAKVAGKTLRITKQIREEGELSVDKLGDLDIAGLHTPKFKERKVRDRHRIAALVTLGGMKADASLFYDLLGGKEQFHAIVDVEATKTDDLVEMQERIKRAIEKAAQRCEGQAETAKANMKAKADVAEGLDLSAPSDETTLRENLRAAFEERSTLTQKRISALEVLNRAATARESLAKAQADVRPIEEFWDAHSDAQKARISAEVLVSRLTRELADAKSDLAVAEVREQAARTACDTANKNAETIKSWQAEITAAEAVNCPSPEAIAEAAAAVDAASMAVNQGATIRAAIKANAESEEFAKQAEIHTTAAKRLRIAAQETQDVLSEAVARIPNCPLRIHHDDNGDARVVIATDRSEREPFDDLSDGERWEPILNIAAKSNRIIVLPQAAFGEMNDSARTRLDALAAEIGCVVLSAQADEGELRCERFACEAVEVEG